MGCGPIAAARRRDIVCDPEGSAASDDAYWYHVSLQAHFTGANGSTTFTDQSRYGYAMTANGNAQIQSNKLELDGTGDYVVMSGGSFNESLMHCPISRFTLRVYGVEFDTLASTQTIASQWNTSTTNRSWRLIHDGTNLVFQWSTDGLGVDGSVSYAWTPNLGLGYDFDVTWDGTTLRLYIDGLFVASGALAIGAIRQSAIGMRIGSSSASGAALDELNGRLKAIQFTRGIARTVHTSGCYTRPILPFPTTQATLTDSEWGNVVLLLETLDDGTIRDASPYDRPLTANGNAAVSTSIEPVANANSLALDGTGDYLSIVDADAFELGSSNFTIETFARHTVNTAEHQYISKYSSTGNQRAWYFGYRGDFATDSLEYIRSTDGTSGTILGLTSAAWTPTTGTWYHAAVTRSGDSHRIFIDGTQSGSTTTISGTIFDSTTAIRIGARDSGGLIYMNGYLSEMRITRGTARYTSNFTAPSAQFPRG